MIIMTMQAGEEDELTKAGYEKISVWRRKVQRGEENIQQCLEEPPSPLQPGLSDLPE